jgi:hypothetical protein
LLGYHSPSFMHNCTQEMGIGFSYSANMARSFYSKQGLKHWLLAAALSLITSLCYAAPTEKPDVTVIGSEFGTFDASDADALVLEPTRVIPHKVGQYYGWVIAVKTKLRSLTVREEYLLPNKEQPSANEASQKDPTRRIVYPQRKQVSQRQLVPIEGRIYGVWTVGQREPAGHRHLQVIVEGEVAASFEYDMR